MKPDTHETAVVIRLTALSRDDWPKTRDVIAFFPEIPGDRDPDTMTCYLYVGQHSSAHRDYAKRCPKGATQEQKDAMLAHLRGLGYNPVEREFKRSDKAKRIKELAAQDARARAAQ